MTINPTKFINYLIEEKQKEINELLALKAERELVLPAIEASLDLTDQQYIIDRVQSNIGQCKKTIRDCNMKLTEYSKFCD